MFDLFLVFNLLLKYLELSKRQKNDKERYLSSVREEKINIQRCCSHTFFSFMDVADHLFEYVCVCVLTELIGLPRCPCMSASSGERQRGDVFPACPLQRNLRLLRVDWEKR